MSSVPHPSEGAGTPGSRARETLSAPARAALDATGQAVGAVFALLSRARRSKSLHPEGVAFTAEVEMLGTDAAPDAPLLRRRATHEGIVRFSRSVGLPAAVPDLLGMSLRLADVHGPGRHQDFLLVTSIDAPVLHHLLLPARDVWSRPYSSSLPYRAGDAHVVIGARPLPGPRPEGPDELERAAAAAATGELRFALGVAPLTGRFVDVGEVRVGARLPDGLDHTPFNPWNTGGGLELDGVLNRLRDYAYPRSQDGWARSRSRA